MKRLFLVAEVELAFNRENYEGFDDVDPSTMTIEDAARLENEEIDKENMDIIVFYSGACKVVVKEIDDADIPPLG